MNAVNAIFVACQRSSRNLKTFRCHPGARIQCVTGTSQKNPRTQQLYVYKKRGHTSFIIFFCFTIFVQSLRRLICCQAQRSTTPGLATDERKKAPCAKRESIHLQLARAWLASSTCCGEYQKTQHLCRELLEPALLYEKRTHISSRRQPS